MALLPPPLFAGPRWGSAALIAGLGHAGLVGAVLINTAQPKPVEPVPVMVVELPQGAAPVPPQAAQPTPQPAPLETLPNMVPPQIDAPQIDAPVPPDPVVIPTPQPLPAPRVQPSARPQPVAQLSAPAPREAETVPVSSNSGRADTGEGDNRRAREAANNWYALISAHLERNKRYPREARREGQQGTPQVRFSVDRRGRVSEVSIRQSSGHALLDEATISLMRRVSPLPPMPRAMQRDSITISLPIEYSLDRK